VQRAALLWSAPGAFSFATPLVQNNATAKGKSAAMGNQRNFFEIKKKIVKNL